MYKSFNRGPHSRVYVAPYFFCTLNIRSLIKQSTAFPLLPKATSNELGEN